MTRGAEPRPSPRPGAGGSPALSPSAVVARLRAAGCVFAEDEARLLCGEGVPPEQLEAMVARRCAGVPLEHVLGWVEFCGLRVAVDEGVFVPRRRSEVLAELASTLVAPGGTLVDVCCGSGALGVAAVRLAARRGVTGVRLVASDLDPVAVRCAARNLAPLGGTALVGDLLQPLPEDLRGGIDVLVANVPYVPTEAIRLMPPEARDHEPRVTLDGGADGLDVLRRLAATAAGWLAPGGRLLTELGPEQVRPARDVLADASFTVEVAGEPDLPALVCSR